jgi:N-methylhydantoinase A/oxoprolinase/acetone carboxylase beta subunit
VYSGKASVVKNKTYIIGIDTGGTYTDAVVIERDAQRILASAKSITTKGDLAVGVGLAMSEAVAALDGAVSAKDIQLVSISTTLATNAVVEGHGGAAAVVLIGFDNKMVERTGIAAAFPDMPLICVAGGHDHNGDVAAKLDVAKLQEELAKLKGRAGAIAIASSFAVRNNAHELAARDMVVELLDLPVTISSELSSALDAPRRALTSVLNARLVGHIARLIAAVKRAMAGLGIVCPLMIMKGDGALASADSVVNRPIETILSGPAASLVGAKWLSGLDDFIMSDMGGTTTDVGILEKGRPLVALQGAEVGGWRTMVKAIDVKTIGLGGDSEIAIGTNGKIEVGPQRAVPLSLLAARRPELLTLLEADLAETEGASLHGRFLVLPFGKDDRPPPDGLNAREAEILAMVSDMPLALRRVAVSTSAQRAIAALRRKGLVQLSGFTPSDAAHVLKLQSNWSAEAAVIGAKLLARFRTMKLLDDDGLNDFCREVWSAAVTKSARIIIDTALGPIADGNTLLEAVCEGRGSVGRTVVSISPAMPIVAVGGPVRIYYDEVARRLGTDVVFAPFCDVANAVGAASALVVDRVTVNVEGDGNGIFRVHGGGSSEQFGSGKLALARALEVAKTLALTQAILRGAVNPIVDISVQKNLMPEARDDDGLLTAIVTAEAMGRPVV